jgi:hypothetical protein
MHYQGLIQVRYPGFIQASYNGEMADTSTMKRGLYYPVLNVAQRSRSVG